MIEQTPDIMFDEFLIVPARCSVNEESVFYLHFFGQKALNFNPIVIAVNLLLLKICIHLVMADLAVKCCNNVFKIIVSFLQCALVT